MADVIDLRNTPHFALEAEVYDRIKRVIEEYEGRISLVSAIGVLELVKLELIPKATP